MFRSLVAFIVKLNKIFKIKLQDIGRHKSEIDIRFEIIKVDFINKTKSFNC